MNISPIYCPDSGCFWSAHGIPDQHEAARGWHLAAHRAEEHGEPLTEEQIAYATRAGHVIPGTARTTAAAVAALPVPVGDQPQPLDDTRLAEIQALDLLAMMPDKSAAIVSRHLAALLAGVQRLKAELAREREDTAFLHRTTLPELRREVEHHKAGKQRWRDRAEKAEARVAELEAERHSTNEALDDAVQALRDMRDRSAEQTRYAAHLEAEICQCQPELESGEYMHEATCPVAEIQMRMLGCPGFEGNPVAPGLCAGCHEPREDHDRPGMHHAIRTINPAEEAR